MNLKLIAAAVSPLMLTFGIAVSATGAGTLDPAAGLACLPALDPSAPASGALKDLNPVQLSHAKAIYDVSVELKLPARAALVAMATVAQESYFKNMANSTVPKSLTLPHEGVGSDHDSVGLFQQRPLPPDGEGGWGTVEELMTPRISATKFYSALRRISGWEQLPITVAAQRVQVSAFPDAYAKHEALATALVQTISGGALTCTGGDVATSGWAKPVKGDFSSGFRTPDRPDHQGVDVSAPRGTPIYAAGPGVVLNALCSSSNCNVEGSLAMGGCGWEVTILHPDRTATRYCHMLTRPLVAKGQPIAAGQQIGMVGNTGNSTGPHLHFECHSQAPISSSNAQEPFAFMKQRGVELA